MKKQQKITELRTVAKLKVSEIGTKIAFAHADVAEIRAGLMRLRSDALKNAETETERFNVIANYRAILADTQAKHSAKVALLKYEIQQAKADCEQQCAAAEDDPEPEIAKEQPQQDTVYCDGSEHSARIVARRLINKMPRVKCDGALFVHIICDSEGDYFVSVSEQSKQPGDYISTIFSKDGHCEKSEAAFIEKARRLFAEEPESGNSHVAETMASASDAVFGGDPVEQVDNLISDTFKDGKEGGNE